MELKIYSNLAFVKGVASNNSIKCNTLTHDFATSWLKNIFAKISK